MPQRSLVPLVITLVGVSMCAAACFVMLMPYQAYQLARGSWRRLRHHTRRRVPRPLAERTGYQL